MMLVTSTDTSSACNIFDSPNALSQKSHGSNNISSICSPLQYIDFTNDTSDISLTNNIVANNAKKHPHPTSTPVSKRNESEEVVSFIPNRPGDKTAQAKYLKSSAKLMKLFGNSEFVKQFYTARNNVKNKILPNITIYKTELAKVEAKLANLRTKINKKLKEIEQRILLKIDDIIMNPLEKNENENNKIIETLQHINLIWKELKL